MQIGSYRVDLIETCRFALDGGAMFGVVPKNLWSRAYPHVDEQNRIAMAARSLLIRGEGKIIVVDAGCGHKMEEKLENIYALDHSTFTLRTGLGEHGVTPEEVTHFIYTHLHFDHAGGSTVLDESGNPVPLFPNARHYVQKEQLTWGRNPTDKDRASFMPGNWEPVVERGLLEELDGDGELFPGIELRTVNGHTRAMQMVIVRDDSGGLVYPADLMPTSAHIGYPYIMGYDNFPLTTLEEKKTFIPEAYERNWLLCFEHDAFTDAVKIKPGKRGFEVEEEVTL
ncbi:MAG: MBL fold metallo-hydrolase [Ignavibacteriae bacterium]|nr:MBL fold metallo-hydrolase [Ignavibacteriota bacterium]MCB9214955.1 MBL fold metallo-hydrolase [Ignavibacteria bacterium]